MSASPTSGLPASIAAEISLAGPQTAGDHVAIGNGVGVKQIVVETWHGSPYLFMINTNDELYYGHLTAGPIDPATNNTSASFGGWTFVTGAAKEIAVDVWQDAPYLYLINSNDDLYYGNLTASPSTGQDSFGGWTFLDGNAKDVDAAEWVGDSYIYLINTSDELSFGHLHASSSSAGAPSADFSGWTFVTGAAKSVEVDEWQAAPFLYLINSNDDLYYGHLYFDPSTPGPPVTQASFSGWTFVSGAAKSVAVTEWDGVPYLYLINSLDHLYFGHLNAIGDVYANTYVAGFTGWYTMKEGEAVAQISVDNWGGSPPERGGGGGPGIFSYLESTPTYIITTTSHEQYSGVIQTDWKDGLSVSRFIWTKIADDTKQTTAVAWQGNPYIYQIDTMGRLAYGDLYTNPNTGETSDEIDFSGWTDLSGSPPPAPPDSGDATKDGVKQLVAETWNDTPYLFMINANNELYYGHLAAGASTSEGYSSDSFSGWTFITGAAKEIAVDIWQNKPYLYLINSKDDLYYGNLYAADAASPTGQDAFSGWQYLTFAVKDVDVVPWDDTSYLFMTSTSDALSYGFLYPSTNNPAYTSFYGWSLVPGDVKSLTVDMGQSSQYPDRDAPYLYMINSQDELQVGTMALITDDPASRINAGFFQSWTHLTDAARSVVVNHWNESGGDDADLYLIGSNGDLEYGVMNVDPITRIITVDDWTPLVEDAKQISVNDSDDVQKVFLYLIDTNNELSQAYRYSVTGDGVPGTGVSPWTLVTGAAKQAVATLWRGKQYLFLINSKDDLYYGHWDDVDGADQPVFSGWSHL